MTDQLKKVLESNIRWSQDSSSCAHFSRFGSGQSQAPQFFCIACADSRIKPLELMGLESGDLFVYRNIANLASNSDQSWNAALYVALEELQVEEILVLGHYGCLGILRAFHGNAGGDSAEWLAPIVETRDQNKEELTKLNTEDEKLALLSELNVIQQVKQIAEHKLIRQAIERGRVISIHGLIYNISEGLLTDLECSVTLSKNVI